MGWIDNVSRLMRGRGAWSADDEFGYYEVAPELVREHAEKQVAWERESFLPGLELARSFGVLDAAELQDARVLDIGAGECLLSLALALAGGAREVVAVDAVPKQIWAAAAQHGTSPRLRFIVGEVTDLPFEEGAFDLVVGNLVLHHVEPLAPVLASIRRVLRPGGRFAAMEPAPLLGMLQHEKTSKNEAPVRPGKIQRELVAAGFDRVETRYWWSRLRTSALGPLSPSYRVSARAPGSGPRVEQLLRRPLRESGLPGLSIDSGCPFAEMVERQAEEIRLLWPHAVAVPGFRAAE